MLAILALAAAAAPIPVDATLLAGLSRHDAAFSAHGARHVCSGPLLREVLARAGAPSGEALRGATLARGVIVRARDGYAVLFSLGELDAGLGNRVAILADRCDGAAIPAADGPVRLVVEGDGRPARSARQVMSLELVGP